MIRAALFFACLLLAGSTPGAHAQTCSKYDDFKSAGASGAYSTLQEWESTCNVGAACDSICVADDCEFPCPNTGPTCPDDGQGGAPGSECLAGFSCGFRATGGTSSGGTSSGDPVKYTAGTSMNPKCQQTGMGCYKSSVGNGACTPCGMGKYTELLTGDVLTAEGHTAESDCKDCQAGKYSDQIQNQMPSCTECELGTYQPLTGMSSCLACPAGKTTEAVGASMESDCVPGETPVTQPNATALIMEVPALEDVKFEPSCAALRFDGSVKDTCSLKGGCLEACLMGGLEVYDKVSGDEVPGGATFFVPTITALPGIAGCSCPPAMGTMAPGSANFVGNYGDLSISFGPREDLLILTLEDCEYYLSVTESKDSDGDGSPDCLGASGVSKDTVTVADARAAATAITVGVAAPIAISVTASVTAALVGGITAAAGGAAASSAAGGALGPLIMQAQFLGIVGQVGGKNNLPAPVRALSEGLAWTNFHLIPVYGEPSSKRGGRRDGNNATQARCDAVKSSETELLGTLSTLGVALASAFKTRFLLRLQQIFSKDHEALKAAGGQGLGQVLGFSWSDVALEDTLFGAYELPVFQKSFQGLAESAAEAASSGCPSYEAGGWVVLVLQFIWIFIVAFLIYKAVAAGYMKFVWFPKSKDGKKARAKPNANAPPAPALLSVAPARNNFGAFPMGAATLEHPMGPVAPIMMHPADMQDLPVYGMRFGTDDITPADYCEIGEFAGETSVMVNGQNVGQSQVDKLMDFAGKIEGKGKGWLMGRFVGDEKQWGEWQKTVHSDKTTSAYYGRLQDLVKEHQGKAYWYQVWIVVMLMSQVIFIKFITDPESNVQAIFWLRIVDTVLRLTVMPQIDKEAYFEDAWAQATNLLQIGSIWQYIQDKAGGSRAGADADGLSQIFLIFSCLGIAPQILFALREAYQKIVAIGDKIKELKDAVGKEVLMSTGMDEEEAQQILESNNAAAAYTQAQAAAGKAAIVFNDPPKPEAPSTGPPPAPPEDALPVFPPMLFSMVDKNKDALAKEAEALKTQANANFFKAQADVNANLAKAQIEAQKAFQNQMQSGLTFGK